MRYTVRVLFFLWILQGYAAFNLTWGTPAVNLDSNPPVGDTDGNAAIAIDPLGNAIATWGRTTGSKASEDIWAAIYNHSLRVWTGAVKISGGGNASNSRVAIDGAGNAVFVWDEGFPTQILSRTLTAQGVWAPDLGMPPTQIHESKNAQISPQIGVDSSGNAVAIWMEFYKGNYHIQSAQKPFGLPWIGLGKISSGVNNAALIATKALAVNEAGDAIAVWQEGKDLFSEIHGARYVKGEWMPPMAIFAQKGEPAQFPSAGIDAAGNAVIVWSQGNAIQSKTLIDGILSETPLIASNPAYIALHPDVGVDAAGNAVVVFERYNAMHKFIAGASLPFKGAAWSLPVEISGPSSSAADIAGYPVLSLNAIGDGAVLWKEHTGTHIAIQAAGYSLGTWSLSKPLSSANGNAGAPVPAYDMAVSVNLAGNMMAVWPEDPAGNGTLQIKATAGVGLANAGPLPPLADPVNILSGVAFGKQVLHRFPAHADLINILTWTSPGGGVAYYKIYRGSLSALVGTSGNGYYEDHQRIPKQQETYLITSVDGNHQESGPMTIVVSPL